MTPNYKRELPGESILITTDRDETKPFHNYEIELKRLVTEGKLKHGEISILDIAHDDWCDIYSRDRCNCKAVIVNRLTGKIIK